MDEGKVSVLVLVCAVAVPACGGDGGGSGDPSGLDAFTSRYRRELCEIAVACGEFPDQDTCEATLVPTDTVAYLTRAAAVDRGAIVVRPDKLDTCLAERLPGCNVGDDQPDACYEIFEGKVPQGGPCASTEECADRAFCEGVDICIDTCCFGTCGPPGQYLALLGGTCSTQSVPACTRGAYCREGTCVSRSAAGLPCDSFYGCQPPAQCGGGSSSGTCAVPPGEGEACDPSATFPCLDENNFCDPSTSVCTRLRPPGASCADDPGSCVGYAICAAGVCRSATLGDACDGTTSPLGLCLDGLVCASNTCAHPPPGMACIP